jgi:hypothetical protein
MGSGQRGRSPQCRGGARPAQGRPRGDGAPRALAGAHAAHPRKLRRDGRSARGAMARGGNARRASHPRRAGVGTATRRGGAHLRRHGRERGASRGSVRDARRCREGLRARSAAAAPRRDARRGRTALLRAEQHLGTRRPSGSLGMAPARPRAAGRVRRGVDAARPGPLRVGQLRKRERDRGASPRTRARSAQRRASRGGALSKALLVLGAREGLALVEALPGCEALLLDVRGGARRTRGWDAAVDWEPLDPET